MKKAGSHEDPIIEINVAPLVDVILVLLIIFMATAPLIQQRAISVNVPRAAHSEPKATETLKLVINDKREIYLADNKITLEDLKQQVPALLKADPLLHLAIVADQVIPYGEVIEVLDIVRGAGVKKVALEVRSKPKNE